MPACGEFASRALSIQKRLTHSWPMLPGFEPQSMQGNFPLNSAARLTTARTREPAWGERRNEVAIDLPEHVLDDFQRRGFISTRAHKLQP
jgi:hypothetical protein